MKVWQIKFRVMLLALLCIAVYTHYQEFGKLWGAIFNGIGMLGLTVIGALAWNEGGE